MRRKIWLALLLSLTVILVACAKDDNKDKEDKEPTSEITADATNQPEPTKEVTDEPSAKPTDEPSATPTPDFDNIFGNEVTTQTYNASPITFVVKGVKYTSPSDYCVTYFENIGPAVYINNVFQMKMLYKDQTFSDLLKSIDELDDKAISGGASSLVEPTTMKVGDREYAYFVVDMSGEKVLGVLTKSPDDKFSMGGQIAILSDKVKYEDLIKMYASIADSASMTDEKDSTKEEIEAQIKYITGEKRKKSTITYKKCKLTYNVPDGFFFTSESEGATTGNQFYEGAELSATASIEEKAFPEDTAEYAVDAAVQYEENVVKGVAEVNGNTIYYYTTHYTSDTSGKVFYNLTAKMDIDDEYTYCVSADCVDKGDIAFEKITAFFEFED